MYRREIQLDFANIFVVVVRKHKTARHRTRRHIAFGIHAHYPHRTNIRLCAYCITNRNRVAHQHMLARQLLRTVDFVYFAQHFFFCFPHKCTIIYLTSVRHVRRDRLCFPPIQRYIFSAEASKIRKRTGGFEIVTHVRVYDDDDDDGM